MSPLEKAIRGTWLVSSLGITLGLSAYTIGNRVGPPLMYGVDTFPESQMSGATLPLWIIVSALVGALVCGVGMRVINEAFESEQPEVAG